MDTPLVDDVTLLLLNPETGRPLTDATRLRAVLPGAVLLDLALRERLESEPSRWGGEKVRVRDASPTGDEVLDEALRRLGDRPTAARTAVQRLGGLKLGRAVRDRMVARGLVRHEPGGFLRFARDHPEPGARKALVAEVASALGKGADVTPHAAALVSLLQSVGAIPKVVPELGLSRRQLTDRVQQISDGMAEGEWAGAAVRAAQTAVTAAIVTSTVAATGGAN
ncbi:GPP34 family phosphoprotein [Kineococcus sp. GCM10028916]|uniref:GOLPH3/VPS74 family protein n=1 Tax=Kineococcus sp. GCM10028916 TaxID=3273394 RepID=UPI003640D356